MLLARMPLVALRIYGPWSSPFPIVSPLALRYLPKHFINRSVTTSKQTNKDPLHVHTCIDRHRQTPRLRLRLRPGSIILSKLVSTRRIATACTLFISAQAHCPRGGLRSLLFFLCPFIAIDLRVLAQDMPWVAFSLPPSLDSSTTLELSTSNGLSTSFRLPAHTHLEHLHLWRTPSRTVAFPLHLIGTRS